LLALKVGDPRVVELHTKAKVIDEVQGELRAFVNAIKFRKQKEQADGG
jgi:hypothetical protein